MILIANVDYFYLKFTKKYKLLIQRAVFFSVTYLCTFASSYIGLDLLLYKTLLEYFIVNI